MLSLPIYKKISNNKRSSFYFLLILQVILLSAYPLLLPTHAAAAQMTNSYIRLDRMAATQPTGGTICVEPSATHTTSISQLDVTFPTGFTVNGTAGNWTVTTTNLPAGTSAFPNIDTASGVSTNTVTFPTTANATLSSGTTYCFNFAASSTLTNGSAANDLTGSMTLTDTTPANNETSNFALSTISAGTDQLAVTASVPATFSFSLTAGNHALGTLSTSSVTSSGTASTGSVSTNAKNGWIAWVKSANGSLHSTTASADISAGAYSTGSGNVVDLASNTGYVLDATTGTGSPTIATEYGGNGTTSGGKLDTNFEQLASKNAPVSGNTFTLKVRAKISATQAAATDYADTLTVVAAGQF